MHHLHHLVHLDHLDHLNHLDRLIHLDLLDHLDHTDYQTILIHPVQYSKVQLSLGQPSSAHNSTFQNSHVESRAARYSLEL